MPTILQTPAITATAQCQHDALVVSWLRNADKNTAARSHETRIRCDDPAMDTLVSWLIQLQFAPVDPNFKRFAGFTLPHRQEQRTYCEIFEHIVLQELSEAGEPLVQLTYKAGQQDDGLLLQEAERSVAITRQQAAGLAKELLQLIRQCCPQQS